MLVLCTTILSWSYYTCTELVILFYNICTREFKSIGTSYITNIDTHLCCSSFYTVTNKENSAIDARKAVQLLMEAMGRKIKSAHDRGEVVDSDDIKLPIMSYKNMFRLARALHFSNAGDSEVHYALHMLEKLRDENEEYATKATKMRENLNYYQRNGTSSNSDYEPSLLRASFQDPVVEYYNFGHDESESLLQRNEGSKAQSILLDELEEGELSSLAFLFGGVGDARHVMATLLDAYHQYLSLSKAKQEKFPTTYDTE